MITNFVHKSSSESHAAVLVVSAQMPMPSQADPLSLCQPQFQNWDSDAKAVISPPTNTTIPIAHPAPTLCVAWLRLLEKLGAWAMLRGWVP